MRSYGLPKLAQLTAEEEFQGRVLGVHLEGARGQNSEIGPRASRPMLLRRMFACGIGLGLCRLTLAILDVTVSLPLVGKLLGQGFRY